MPLRARLVECQSTHQNVSMVSSSLRVRLAPSPTGNLHVGTARTGLYNYLFARHGKGDFVLRLEDTDELRSKDEYTQDILDGMKWLGLNWDEGPDIGGPFPPYKQTQKIDHYDQMAKKLIKSGHAYFCFCSAEELNEMKEQQKTAPRYDNRCRHLSPEQINQHEAAGHAPAIRLKIEEPRTISWNDMIKGEISIESSDLGGDMVIVKSSGVALYNFAVVVDDLDMKMTHVIRGEDHIHNTAKQLMLYEAFGAKAPEFAHAPLMFDTERHKLSKRAHGEMVHVDFYRRSGYMPEAILNYLAQMSWTPPEGQEIFTLEEACQMFTLDRVSKSPAVFDVPRLNWYNGHYLRHLPLATVTDRALPFLQTYDLQQYTRPQLEEIVAVVREGLTTLSEITEAVRFFFDKQVPIPPEVNDTVMCTDNGKKVLNAVLSNLATFPWGDVKGCKSAIDQIGKELSLKGKDLYWPVRAALQGKTSGPDLGFTLAMLGEARVRNRIEGALGLCPR
jgi:nondiscriminating glutamyl-tRNA synthetase